MECWYDSLFECDCAGIYELMKVPCAGNFETISMYRQPDGRLVGLPGPMDKKLQKRISWILRCASIASFDLIGYDHWATKTYRYFIQARSIRIWYETAGVWAWETRDLKPYSCYYLGRYPWYWDFDYFRVVSPHGSTPIPVQTPEVYNYLITVMETVTDPITLKKITRRKKSPLGEFSFPKVRNLQPFGFAPSYPGIEWDIYKLRPQEENIYFLGPKPVYTWNEQQALTNYMDKRFKECLAKKYPPPVRKPKRIVQAPEGPAEWPGIPMNQLKTPTPGMPGPPPKMQLQLIFTYTPPKRPDGLWTTLEIKGPF